MKAFFFSVFDWRIKVQLKRTENDSNSEEKVIEKVIRLKHKDIKTKTQKKRINNLQ